MDHRKIIIVIICLTLASVGIYRQPSSKAVPKNLPLSQALSDVQGWANNGLSPFDTNIVKSLKLDDYINNSYSKGTKIVNLYIGYYLTSKKVGAAHDPLVCFPGQGWLLSDKQKGILQLDADAGMSISYSMMTAQREQQKDLIIYWFQSYDKTNPDTLSQKLTSLWKKVSKNAEDNAFVRISTPIREGQPLPEAKETILRFIRSFYPLFFNYVKQKEGIA